MNREELEERLAKAIASETFSLAFMEPHPLEGSLTAKCREEDRKTAFRIARACLASIEEAGMVVVERGRLWNLQWVIDAGDRKKEIDGMIAALK